MCLHGFPDSPHTYRYLMPALAGAGYRAVAPYLRGFAPTGLAPDGSYHIDDLVNDVVGLHKELGGDGDAVLICHDWGALMGWGAPVRAPDRFRKVVIANIPPLQVAATVILTPAMVQRIAYVFFFQTVAAEAVVSAEDFAFIDYLWSYWSPGYEATEDLPRAKDCLRDPANLSAALGYYRSFFDPKRFGTEEAGAEQFAAWGSVPSQPVLYLHGSQDGIYPFDQAAVDGIGALLAPGSEAQLIQGAGHFLVVEKPGEVNERILRFLEGRE